MGDHNFGAMLADNLSETSQPPTPFLTSGRIVEQAARLLDEYGCQYREQIHAAAMAAYEQFVRPIDLPGVPNLIEPAVDRMIGEALDRMLTSVFDRICMGS